MSTVIEHLKKLIKRNFEMSCMGDWVEATAKAGLCWRKVMSLILDTLVSLQNQIYPFWKILKREGYSLVIITQTLQGIQLSIIP